MKSSIKQIGIILLVGAALAVVGNFLHPRRIPWVQDWSLQVEERAAELGIPVTSLSVTAQKHQAGKSVFIDARPAEQFAEGHIPGAVSVPFDQLEDRIPELMELLMDGTELILYCSSRTCDDALLLASELQSMGARSILLFVDGYDSWDEYGGAIE